MVGFDGNGARSRLLPFLGALGTFPLTVAFLRFFALSPFLARGRGRVQTANAANAVNAGPMPYKQKEKERTRERGRGLLSEGSGLNLADHLGRSRPSRATDNFFFSGVEPALDHCLPLLEAILGSRPQCSIPAPFIHQSIRRLFKRNQPLVQAGTGVPHLRQSRITGVRKAKLRSPARVGWAGQASHRI